MRPEEIAADPLLEETWYYSLELAPDLWTNGRDHFNVVLTRELLAGVELAADDTALDIGTQEAMVPVLLKRRGVGSVVASDRILRKRRIELVQRALEVDFELLGGGSINDLGPRLWEAGQRPFDLVVFSGVLYHMLDPFGGIASVRGLVRDGGLVVVETTTAFTDDVAIHLSLGRFSDHSICAPSIGALDAMLRAVGLDPIDAVRLGIQDKGGGLRLSRCAIACRARSDRRLPKGMGAPDLAEYIDWDRLRSDRPPLGYLPSSGRAALADEAGAAIAVADSEAIRPERERSRLALGDAF